VHIDGDRALMNRKRIGFCGGVLYVVSHSFITTANS
jgi:hypothetical protein